MEKTILEEYVGKRVQITPGQNDKRGLDYLGRVIRYDGTHMKIRPYVRFDPKSENLGNKLADLDLAERGERSESGIDDEIALHRDEIRFIEPLQ